MCLHCCRRTGIFTARNRECDRTVVTATDCGRRLRLPYTREEIRLQKGQLFYCVCWCRLCTLDLWGLQQGSARCHSLFLSCACFQVLISFCLYLIFCSTAIPSLRVLQDRSVLHYRSVTASVATEPVGIVYKHMYRLAIVRVLRGMLRHAYTPTCCCFIRNALFWTLLLLLMATRCLAITLCLSANGIHINNSVPAALAGSTNGIAMTFTAVGRCSFCN